LSASEAEARLVDDPPFDPDAAFDEEFDPEPRVLDPEPATGELDAEGLLERDPVSFDAPHPMSGRTTAAATARAVRRTTRR
jgi:hypothetical protein